MNTIYRENAKLSKALASPIRLMIIDMLSCGELCACKILEKFKITQPTLSHHMRILCGCGLVKGRREGKWMYYSIDGRKAKDMVNFLCVITTGKKNCICRGIELRATKPRKEKTV